MLKEFISVATICSFVCVSSPAALAQSADVYDPHSNFGQRSEVSASLYVRIPFNGGLKRSSNEEARFGLALRTTLPQSFSTAANNYGYAFQGFGSRQIKVLDLSIGSNGFKSFKLNGHSLAEFNALYADEEGDGKKKKKVWPWVVGGLALTGIVVGVVFTTQCDTDGPLGTFNCD